MLGCTFNEYKDRFEENLAKYLEAYEDNTPLSFLKNQEELYNVFIDELNKISNELKTYGEIKANDRFLRSSFFHVLVDIDIDTYNDILIENRRIDSLEVYFSIQDSKKNNNDRYDWFEARINYIKLKKHIVSAEKILKFIEGKYQIFEQEEQQIITLALGQQDAQSNIKLIISAGVEPTRLETEDRVDPDKSKKNIIENNLKEFKGYLSEEDYKLLANSLLIYCKTDNFPQLDHMIMFKPINKKNVGWALKEIHKTIKTGKLNMKLFEFAQQNISLFKDEVIVKDNFHRSSFYKAFTTNPN
jgi:hypothetical protein